jgi:predicted DNA repair protein MutK
MDEMTQTSDIHMMIGEMRGQLREAIHTMNNTSQKIDGLIREVAEIKGVSIVVAAMEVRLKAVENKVETLEADKSRRQGALSLGEWIVRLMPWLIGGAAFAAMAKLIGVGV